MKRYFLDYNERQIVHAAVRMDSRRGKSSPFSQRAAEAIRKAKDDMDVGDIAPDVRSVIVDKIYQSIAYGQPWERLGETYCYRGQFYQLRKQFCYLVADYMGLIDARQQRGSRGSGIGWRKIFQTGFIIRPHGSGRGRRISYTRAGIANAADVRSSRGSGRLRI